MLTITVYQDATETAKQNDMTESLIKEFSSGVLEIAQQMKITQDLKFNASDEFSQCLVVNNLCDQM